MTEFLMGLAIGVLTGFLVILPGYKAFNIEPLIKKCELDLPRTQNCELVAVPVLEARK